MESQWFLAPLLLFINYVGGLEIGYHLGCIAPALSPLQDSFPSHFTRNPDGSLTFTAAVWSGVITSAGVLGSGFGSILGGQLADVIGRKYTLLVLILLGSAFSLCSALLPLFELIVVSRFIVGLAVGIDSTVCPLYVSEMARPKQRGAFGTLFNLGINSGVVLSYCMGYVFSPIGTQSWRYVFGFLFVIFALQFIAFVAMPESATWRHNLAEKKKLKRERKQKRKQIAVEQDGEDDKPVDNTISGELNEGIDAEDKEESSTHHTQSSLQVDSDGELDENSNAQGSDTSPQTNHAVDLSDEQTNLPSDSLAAAAQGNKGEMDGIMEDNITGENIELSAPTIADDEPDLELADLDATTKETDTAKTENLENHENLSVSVPDTAYPSHVHPRLIIFWLLFCDVSNVKRLLLGFLLTSALILTGVNSADFFMPTIFEMAGFDHTMVNIGTIAVGAWSLLTTIPGVFLVDRYGRKLLTLGGLVIMGFSMLVCGFNFLFVPPPYVGYVSIGCIAFFFVGFNIGIGTTFFVVLPELPWHPRVRDLAVGLFTGLQWFFSFIFGLAFLPLSILIGIYGVYWLLAAVCIVTCVLLFFLLPETMHRQKSQDGGIEGENKV